MFGPTGRKALKDDYENNGGNFLVPLQIFIAGSAVYVVSW